MTCKEGQSSPVRMQYPPSEGGRSGGGYPPPSMGQEYMGPPGPGVYQDEKYMEDEVDDILPDTNIDRERTLTGKWALAILAIAVGFSLLAFVTPNWLEGDPRFYGNKVDRVGLWVHCFRSLPDYNDPYHQRYYAGCRWIFNPFTKGYDKIRPYLVPRKQHNYPKKSEPHIGPPPPPLAWPNRHFNVMSVRSISNE